VCRRAQQSANRRSLSGQDGQSSHVPSLVGRVNGYAQQVSEHNSRNSSILQLGVIALLLEGGILIDAEDCCVPGFYSLIMHRRWV
jgi:hypothetical protein